MTLCIYRIFDASARITAISLGFIRKPMCLSREETTEELLWLNRGLNDTFLFFYIS